MGAIKFSLAFQNLATKHFFRTVHEANEDQILRASQHLVIKFKCIMGPQLETSYTYRTIYSLQYINQLIGSIKMHLIRVTHINILNKVR